MDDNDGDAGNDDDGNDNIDDISLFIFNRYVQWSILLTHLSHEQDQIILLIWSLFNTFTPGNTK